MDGNDVFITGIGLITPVGIGKEEAWQNMLQGKSGIKYISLFDASNLPVKIAGELCSDFEYVARGFFKRKSNYNQTIRFSKIGVMAASLSLKDAGIELRNEDTRKIGICIGTGIGGLLFTEEQVMQFYKNWNNNDLLSIVKVTPNAASSNIAINLNIKGPSLTVTTACASGGHAIGVAYDLIKMNRIDLALAGGIETPISPLAILGFNSLGALSPRNGEPEKASRPFDKNRNGFVISEGGGIIVLESRRHLEARGGRAYCQMRDWAFNSEAYSMVAPIETGDGMGEIMDIALDNAGVQKSEVDYINAHGTSTILNDISETKAIKKVFGSLSSQISISSTKSMIGHTLGASGAIEVAVTALSVYHDKITPTINLENHDHQCDLDYTPNIAVSKNIRAAISNSFGFGGNNCCIVLSK
ncbi:MAG: beta-ketoacyl-[acyl-carrier-protein] synthase family protein [Nitrospinae bacterium]|nr:beta-ketoacyl-[acyl-carrier-protein] synthase family protein [Nitrospinota bacterium]